MKKKLFLLISIAVGLLAIVLLLLNLQRIKARFPAQGGGSVGSFVQMFNQAKELEAQNNLLEARQIYKKLIEEFPASHEVANWQKKVESMNIKLLFSGVQTPESTEYEIRPGDTLVKIAKEFKTTVDLIKQSNNFSSSKINPGRKIKIIKTPFSILVDKSNNLLLLKSGEEVFKTYIVSTGKNNCTPVGTFKIVDKLVDPTWFKAGAVIPPNSPENVLGSRWMGFDLKSYGIHGTTEPQNLGKQITQGCVRMSNSEVEELYSIIPVGTEVTIID